MELRDLEYFLAVAESGSFTLAAQQRGLSQQALSKSLARLEGELGVPLLERTPKGVLLTGMGEALRIRAQTVLAEVSHFRRDVDVALGRSTSQLALALSPVASAGVGRNAVIRLQQRYPRLNLRIEGGLAPQFVRLLLAGEIDLAVTTGGGDVDPQIMVTALGDERWLVVGRRGNPMLTRARSIADLGGADWIFGKLPEGLGQPVDEHFLAAGVPPIQPRIITTSLPFAISVLEATDMLAILPRSMVVAAPGLMGRDLAQGGWTTPLIAMRRRRAVSSAAATDLIAILQEEARRAGGDIE
ncbi:LysR family transcriptional regulator [Nitrospirillum iridis]|uniref:DNA-binding transcriptional LysR family regulator n=1 Tax=Nitrospirillum iridis TaxID=765888 RepID=A0A7X0B1Q1_9PROT|nr:LysR family transcriptional regulator [Nitrospirillum iridis]MBB6253075.1 DNA-binding transcriptional LysR family regulator [Nitrospirillum iridis]